MRKCRHGHYITTADSEIWTCKLCGAKGTYLELAGPFSYEPHCKGRPTADRLEEIEEYFNDGRFGPGMGRGDAHPAIRDLLNEIRALNNESEMAELEARSEK